MIWLSRGKRPLLNRNTGVLATGNYSSRIEGPEGVATSGMSFDGTKSLVVPMRRAIDGKMTFQAYVKLVIPSAVFYTKTEITATTILGYKPADPELGRLRVGLTIARVVSILKNGAYVVYDNTLGNSIDFYQTYYRHGASCDLGAQPETLIVKGYSYHLQGLGEGNYTPVISWNSTDGFILTFLAPSQNPFHKEWDEGGDHYVFGYTDSVYSPWTVSVIK